MFHESMNGMATHNHVYVEKESKHITIKIQQCTENKNPKRHMNFGGCRGDQIRIGQHATMGGLLMGCLAAACKRPATRITSTCIQLGDSGQPWGVGD